MATHVEEEQGDDKCHGNPESLCHVTKLRASPAFLPKRLQRLECHSADRAAPGCAATDLRVHRAGVDRAGGCPGGGLCGNALRISGVLPATALRGGSMAGAHGGSSPPRARRIGQSAALPCPGQAAIKVAKPWRTCSSAAIRRSTSASFFCAARLTCATSRRPESESRSRTSFRVNP